MFKSDPLRLMFERSYFQRDHNVLAIYPTYRMARDEFGLAFDDVREQLPTSLVAKISDRIIQFPEGNRLQFMHMSVEMDMHRLMGWQLVDYFVHESMRQMWWYDRMIQMLACRVRSK